MMVSLGSSHVLPIFKTFNSINRDTLDTTTQEITSTINSKNSHTCYATKPVSRLPRFVSIKLKKSGSASSRILFFPSGFLPPFLMQLLHNPVDFFPNLPINAVQPLQRNHWNYQNSLISLNEFNTGTLPQIIPSPNLRRNSNRPLLSYNVSQTFTNSSLKSMAFNLYVIQSLATSNLNHHTLHSYQHPLSLAKSLPRILLGRCDFPS